MPLLTGESHLKHLAALEAANRHRHWELPFHNVLSVAEQRASPTAADSDGRAQKTIIEFARHGERKARAAGNDDAQPRAAHGARL
jgi:hypothetical protein